MPQPMPISENCIILLNDLMSKSQWTPEISAAFTAMAYRQREVDVGEGDMLLGIIHAINKDVPRMRKCFKNSLAYGTDKTAVLVNYGQGLYFNGFFSEAIDTLLPVHEKDSQSCLVIAMSCMALGLEAKAKQFYKISGENIPFEDFFRDRKFPHPQTDKGIDAVFQSMEKDYTIWENLSKR